MSNSAEQAFTPVRAAIGAGRIPGGVLGVLEADGSRSVALAGDTQIEPVPEPVERDT